MIPSFLVDFVDGHYEYVLGVSITTGFITIIN